jgi:hypothetical protein
MDYEVLESIGLKGYVVMARVISQNPNPKNILKLFVLQAIAPQTPKIPDALDSSPRGWKIKSGEFCNQGDLSIIDSVTYDSLKSLHNTSPDDFIKTWRKYRL